MKRKLWTAVVEWHGLVLAAQDKSSKRSLINRLKQDDPLWSKPTVSYLRMKEINSRHFKKGMAIVVIGEVPHRGTW